MICYYCGVEHEFSKSVDVEMVSKITPPGYTWPTERLGFSFDLCKECFESLVNETQHFVSERMHLVYIRNKKKV